MGEPLGSLTETATYERHIPLFGRFKLVLSSEVVNDFTGVSDYIGNSASNPSLTITPSHGEFDTRAGIDLLWRPRPNFLGSIGRRLFFEAGVSAERFTEEGGFAENKIASLNLGLRMNLDSSLERGVRRLKGFFSSQ